MLTTMYSAVKKTGNDWPHAARVLAAVGYSQVLHICTTTCTLYDLQDWSEVQL